MQFPAGSAVGGPMCSSWASNAGGPCGLKSDCPRASRARYNCPHSCGVGKLVQRVEGLFLEAGKAEMRSNTSSGPIQDA